ncbi:heparinase II/III family protein [Pseudomonas sp. MWU12-2345]|uniref:heparinase II/III family protein n=1 Tax=Pseudomonas sp. MWU12-2345 TaxID=2928689 RepID=UPI00200FCBF7|nr:heparinase II/III family protein [Pseudomonas sp. MWU12-2345]
MGDVLMSRFLKLYHTVKTLRLKQIVYRIYYRFVKVGPFVVLGYKKSTSFGLGQIPAWSASRLTSDKQFEFMGIKQPVQWNSSTLPKIWLYNLHYLDCLTSVDVTSDALDSYIVNRWIEENPPYSGCAWEPYTLSLRIVNLLKWFRGRSDLKQDWLDSLALQTFALSKQVEYHILANHLFVNGKALLMAGCFLDGLHVEYWRHLGLKILDREIDEQFLSDGAHYELSPMYHASLIWDMCDLVNLAAHTRWAPLAERLEKWKAVVRQGIIWLRDIQHPDGDIPFFNDSAFGIAPRLRDIEAYAQLLGCLPPPMQFVAGGVAARCYKDSGYGVIDLDEGGKALMSFAQIAPDYQPGHAHADTLSFELSLFGQRVFVNSGTSRYGEDRERHRQRSTAAHNTVEVNGENSSEVWAGFRVARRARAELEAFESVDDSARIACNHDGYIRLRGRNMHRREWRATAGELQIIDSITGAFDCALSRFFVHPDATVLRDGRNVSVVLPLGGVVHVCFRGAVNINVVDSTWHPEFGKSIPNQCIIAELSSEILMTTITW